MPHGRREALKVAHGATNRTRHQEEALDRVRASSPSVANSQHDTAQDFHHSLDPGRDRAALNALNAYGPRTSGLTATSSGDRAAGSMALLQPRDIPLPGVAPARMRVILEKVNDAAMPTLERYHADIEHIPGGLQLFKQKLRRALVAACRSVSGTVRFLAGLVTTTLAIVKSILTAVRTPAERGPAPFAGADPTSPGPPAAALKAISTEQNAAPALIGPKTALVRGDAHTPPHVAAATQESPMPSPRSLLRDPGPPHAQESFRKWLAKREARHRLERLTQGRYSSLRQSRVNKANSKPLVVYDVDVVPTQLSLLGDYWAKRLPLFLDDEGKELPVFELQAHQFYLCGEVMESAAPGYEAIAALMFFREDGQIDVAIRLQGQTYHDCGLLTARLDKDKKWDIVTIRDEHDGPIRRAERPDSEQDSESESDQDPYLDDYSSDFDNSNGANRRPVNTDGDNATTLVLRTRGSTAPALADNSNHQVGTGSDTNTHDVPDIETGNHSYMQTAEGDDGMNVSDDVTGNGGGRDDEDGGGGQDEDAGSKHQDGDQDEGETAEGGQDGLDDLAERINGWKAGEEVKNEKGDQDGGQTVEGGQDGLNDLAGRLRGCKVEDDVKNEKGGQDGVEDAGTGRDKVRKEAGDRDNVEDEVEDDDGDDDDDNVDYDDVDDFKPSTLSREIITDSDDEDNAPEST